MNLNKRILDRKLKISLYIGIILGYHQSKTAKLIFLINHARLHEKAKNNPNMILQFCCTMLQHYLPTYYPLYAQK